MTITDFIKHYSEAISSQDWLNVEALVHPDCVVTFTTGTYRGKDEVEKVFRNNFRLIQDEVFTISNVEFIKESTEFAVYTFHYTWRGLIDGKPAEGGGRGTSVIVTVDGRWQLLSEHLGPHPQ